MLVWLGGWLGSEWMGSGIEEWVVSRMNVWRCGWMHQRILKWLFGWLVVWMKGGWVEGRVDGLTCEKVYGQ